jgi:hypothetical protein
LSRADVRHATPEIRLLAKTPARLTTLDSEEEVAVDRDGSAVEYPAIV